MYVRVCVCLYESERNGRLHKINKEERESKYKYTKMLNQVNCQAGSEERDR